MIEIPTPLYHLRCLCTVSLQKLSLTFCLEQQLLYIQLPHKELQVVR